MKLRRLRENEIKILQDFLYEAIFIPEGVEPPAKDIIYQPELKVYYITIQGISRAGYWNKDDE